MKSRITVWCPYCGRIKSVDVKNEHDGMQVVTCDSTNDGCGKHFVVHSRISIKSTVLKIEGQEAAQAEEGGQ